MGSYQPLFHFAVQHLFFSEARHLKLDFVPTPATQALLQRAALLTRNTENGFGLFYDTAQTEALGYYLSDIHDPFSFQYCVFSKDPLFANYTQAPSYKDDAMLYFDNEMAKADVSDYYRLHSSEYVSPVDFKSLESPELIESLSEKDRRVKPVFVLNITLVDGILSEAAKTYVIKFDTRKTYWKYYLLGDLAEKEPYILDLNNKTEFEFAGTTTLPGRKRAIVFRSTTAIPLRERFPLRFQLKEKRVGNGKVIIKRLPLASACQISTETINGKESVISEIYVNC